MQAKAANSAIYLVGKRKDECGGSRYYEILEEIAKCEKDELLGANVPQPQFEEVAQQIEFVTGAINKGFTTACHDISEGGLLMAIFEMLLPHRKVGGDIGMQIDASTMLSTSLSALKSSERPDAILFSETGGFLLEVSAENEQRFLDLAKSCNIDAIRIGQTTDEATISIQNGDLTLFDESLAPLIDTWKSALEGAWK